ALVGTIQSIGSDHRKHAVLTKIREQVVLFSERTKILPSHAEVQRQSRGQAKIILGEKAKTIIEGVALSVAGIHIGVGAAEIKICQCDGARGALNWVGCQPEAQRHIGWPGSWAGTE